MRLIFTAKMHRSSWKKGESRIAKIFGTFRTPLSGYNSRHTQSDTLSDRLFIEVKHRKKIPGDSLWNKTIELSKKENKIPMVVFIKKGSHNPLILCNLADIKKISEQIR